MYEKGKNETNWINLPNLIFYAHTPLIAEHCHNTQHFSSFHFFTCVFSHFFLLCSLIVRRQVLQLQLSNNNNKKYKRENKFIRNFFRAEINRCNIAIWLYIFFSSYCYYAAVVSIMSCIRSRYFIFILTTPHNVKIWPMWWMLCATYNKPNHHHQINGRYMFS